MSNLRRTHKYVLLFQPKHVNPTRCLNTIMYCVGAFKRKSDVHSSPLQRSDVPDVASVCDILGYRLVA